ncbi:MAG: Gfo/Idh/MocA family oxidoreductase [Phycisphaerae bacterium]|nr:Gfo/Idh/MocA family oxidoreductase [Phycisphaerae bacterium]
MVRNGLSRRDFLKASAAAWGFTVVPSSVLGQMAPSERIGVGMIGVGNMGSSNLKGFMGNPGFQVVAVCDVDRFYRDPAIKAAKLTAKDGYNDFREVLDRKDVDAVCISTPDHWHAIPTIAAAKAGKDIYCEKPMTLTIAEGRAMVNACKRYGRVLQTGSMQRSDARFLQACELVRNGHIGDIKQVFVEIPGNNRDNPLDWKEEPIPDGFDYNFWLGQAPQAPYTKMRCHYTFRFILDYSGGQMTNWGAHYLDIAQWGLGMDDSGPVKVKGKGEFPKGGLFTTAVKADITYTYANGVELILHQEKGGNTKFVGTKGSVSVNRDRIVTEPQSLAEHKTGPDEIHLIRSVDHKMNFLECIKSRQNPICHAEVGHRSATLCHLGNIAMLLDRELNWDPVKEKFVNDPEADAMISRNMRAPWTL